MLRRMSVFKPRWVTLRIHCYVIACEAFGPHYSCGAGVVLSSMVGDIGCKGRGSGGDEERVVFVTNLEV